MSKEFGENRQQNGTEWPVIIGMADSDHNEWTSYTKGLRVNSEDPLPREAKAKYFDRQIIPRLHGYGWQRRERSSARMKSRSSIWKIKQFLLLSGLPLQAARAPAGNPFLLPASGCPTKICFPFHTDVRDFCLALNHSWHSNNMHLAPFRSKISKLCANNCRFQAQQCCNWVAELFFEWYQFSDKSFQPYWLKVNENSRWLF